MKVVNFDHVQISVSDISVAKKFYSETLGLETLPTPKAFGPGTVWFKCGDKFLHVSETEEHDTIKSGRHFAIDVENLEKAYKELMSKGVKIDKGPTREVKLYRLFCFDPDGNRIEIRQAK